LNIAIQIFAQDFFIEEKFLFQHVITIKMMETRQGWESMHEHFGLEFGPWMQGFKI